MNKLQPIQSGVPQFSALLSPVVLHPTPMLTHAAIAAEALPGVLGQVHRATVAARAAQTPHEGHAGARGSARRKLWDMTPSAACPVTGVCLNFRDLYQLARKAGLSVKDCTEYEVHAQVVGECRRRGDVAELVQRELDARYALDVKRAVQTIKTTDDLAKWWDKASRGADWAGVFWAVLTHPRCSADLESMVLGQVHMLQHQVGMASRVERTKLQDVLDENLRLGEALELTQVRLRSAAQGHAREMAQMQACLVQLRGEVIRAQTERDQVMTQWQALKTQVPDLRSRQALADENAHLLAHNRQLRRSLIQGEPARAAVVPTSAGVPQTCTGKGKPCAPSAEGAPLQLADRSVLCVGGRTGGVPVYRELVEHQGGRFVHHDGGEENRLAQLGNHLHAADVVICQVGCISHNAYWRVKEHCKRTGTPCLFVASASRAALERALGLAMTGAKVDKGSCVESTRKK